MIDKKKISINLEHIKNLIKKNKLLEAKEESLNINNSYKKNSEIINLLGLIELSLGNFEASLKYFEEAIKIKPDDPKIYNNLGILNYKNGKIENAINCFNKATAIDKTLISPYENLAKIKLSQSNYKEAKVNFEKVLEIDPKNLDSLLSLSDILLIEKKYLETKKILEKIIELEPDNFEAYNNLGNIFIKLNKIDDALKNLIKSNKIKPNKAAYNNIGLVYKEKKDFDKSILNFEKALYIDPSYLDSLYNLAIVQMDIGKFENSIENFNKILKINKNYQRVFGKIIHSEKIICNWQDHDKKIKKLEDKILNNENCITPWETLSIFDSEKIQLKVAETWIKNNFIKYDFPNLLESKKRNEKLKIGYFSSDFFNTAVSNQIIKIIEFHDRSKFEIIAFSLINNEDTMQKKLQQTFDKFINIEGKSSNEIFESCREINIDIAIDLNGFTLNNRFEIFEKRCAPIQISYLGYSATTGSKNIDYIIADKEVIPKESQKYFSEKIIYLPSTYITNGKKDKILDLKASKEQYDVPLNSFLLGCFNQHYKITPEMFNVWIKILKKNDLCFILLNEGNNLSRKNLLNYASNQGIKTNKLIFTKKLSSLSDHLNRLRFIDLFIDTFPYGSHTTACDALLAGKPIVTLKGNSFASRIASSLLKSLNLEYLITESFQDYEDKINNLISNKSMLKELNIKIIENQNKSTLFNAKTFTQNLEKAYLQVYENLINKKKPNNVYLN